MWNLSYSRHHLPPRPNKGPESCSTKEDHLAKHLGDLKVCSPFPCATELLELCNEPNLAKGPDLV